MLNSMIPGYADIYERGAGPKNELIKPYGAVLEDAILKIKNPKFKDSDVFVAVTEFFISVVKRASTIATQTDHQIPAKAWDRKTTAKKTALRDLLDFHIQPLIGVSLDKLFKHAKFDDLSVDPQGAAPGQPLATTGAAGTSAAGATAASAASADPAAKVGDAPAADAVQPGAEQPSHKRSRIKLHAQDALETALFAIPEPTADALDLAKDPNVRLAAFSQFATTTAEGCIEAMLKLGVPQAVVDSAEYRNFAGAAGSATAGFFLGSDKFASLVSTLKVSKLVK